MKLYILTFRGYTNKNRLTRNCVIVRAKSARDARRLASERWYDINKHLDCGLVAHRAPWADAAATKVQQLRLNGKPGVIK